MTRLILFAYGLAVAHIGCAVAPKVLAIVRPDDWLPAALLASGFGLMSLYGGLWLCWQAVFGEEG